MYQEILTIWKEERALGEQLANLPADFYQRAAKYLAHLETSASLKEDSIAKGLLQQKTSRVSFLIRDLLRLRIEKLLYMVNEGKEIPIDNITIEEHEFIYDYNTLFQDLLKKVFRYELPKSQHDKSIREEEEKQGQEERARSDQTTNEMDESIAIDKEPEILEEGFEEDSIKIDLTYVEVTVDYLNEFVGVDLRPYGPYRNGDIILLPKENAKHLIRTGQGKEINVFYQDTIQSTSVYIPEEGI